MNGSKTSGPTLTGWRALAYRLLFAVAYLISLLPLCVLYRLADLLYLILYRMMRYRVGLVRKNLAESFPDKTAKERLHIERAFFHFLADYMIETIKLASISEHEMRRRMRFEGTELLVDAVAAGRACTVMLGHYCNWEWVSTLPIHLPAMDTIGQIYHELENPVMDKLMLRIRERFGARCIEMHQTLQTLIQWQRAGKPSIVGYICDQVPGYNDMHCWPFFLGHDTPAYTGPERMSRVLGTSLFYFDITRPKRGYYVCRVVKLSDDARQMENFQPTLTFFRLLEESIRREPAWWLWSHNRWKRTREQFNERFTEEQRKRILSRP